MVTEMVTATTLALIQLLPTLMELQLSASATVWFLPKFWATIQTAIRTENFSSATSPFLHS